MAHIQARDTFFINADKIMVAGRHATDNEVDFETNGNKKIRFNQPLDIDNANGAFIQGKKGQQLIKDETGNAVMEIKSDGNLRCLVPIDFNNQQPVNFSGGGGGGGATTTSGISSENLVGQTLEDELDAITTQQTTNTTAIASNTAAIGTNSTNIASNTTAIGTNTTNIATNTAGVSALQTQQLTNTNNIATNTANVASLQTQQATNTGNITNLQTTQTSQATDIGNLQTTQGTQQTAIASLQTQQLTNTGNITNLQTTQGTQATTISSLQTQQNLNTTAIASNTARTTGLTADRILISSSTGDITAAQLEIADVVTKYTSNPFTAPPGDPDTLNEFDSINSKNITNTGTIESVSYTQNGAALNFSHLAGSATSSQLPTEAVKTDVADQTIQGQPSTSALTKMTIDNTHATGNTQFVVQKRTTGGVLERGIVIQANQSGINITGQAPVGNTPDISITPANGSLAMTIGGQESRFHNNLKILGSMSGAARSDQKEYIFKTDGTGTGGTLLLEDVIKRPTTGNPAAGFNPAADSVIQLNSSGVPSYKAVSDFLSKPGNANPTLATSFISVSTTGVLAYVPNTFVPLAGGVFPSSGENVVFVNPGGSSYVDRANLIERPGNANPASGNNLITIDNTGTRAYLPENELIKTTATSQTIASSASSVSFEINCNSATQGDEASLKISRTGGGDNDIELIPKRGTFCEWRCKNDLRVFINGNTKMGVGNHTIDMFKPIVMQTGNDVRLQTTFTAPANSSSTGTMGTIGFDANHLYVAVGTNSWKRVALSTF
jgi:hypothetical protein